MNTEKTALTGTLSCQRFWKRYLCTLPLLVPTAIGVVLAGNRVWGQVLVSVLLIAALIVYFRLTEHAAWVRYEAAYTVENGQLTVTQGEKTTTLALADATECMVGGCNVWTSPCRMLVLKTKGGRIKLFSAPIPPEDDPEAISEQDDFGRLFLAIKANTPQLVPQKIMGQELEGTLVLPKA